MSRLFRAVVGAGIALGAAAACGHIEGDGGALSALGEGSAAPDAASDQTAAAADAAPRADAAGVTPSADGGAVDAAIDATLDATIDAAFCDNTWPTTKGHGEETPALCVDPKGDCVKVGPPHHCYADLGGGLCGGPDLSPFCVADAGVWQCQAGTIRRETCRCFGTAPEPGASCTDGGWTAVDGAVLYPPPFVLPPASDGGSDAATEGG